MLPDMRGRICIDPKNLSSAMAEMIRYKCGCPGKRYGREV